jgi:multidrug/hemolysin transport system permease protein
MKAEKNKINYAEQLGKLIKRHLLVFVYNRMRVFYTLMVPFIIFAIYIFFLRDLELTTITPMLTEYGLSTTDKTLGNYINTLVDTWMLSGIIAMSTITVSLQTNNIIVSDKENGINRDFASSPVSNSMLIMSYFVSTFIITLSVCFIFLLVCLIYLAALGEFLITFVNFLSILGILIYVTINSVLFTVFICSFVSHDSTMASIITIVSTAIGFLIGAYMPLFMMPTWVQNVCAFIPGTYGCALFRFAFMANPISEMSNYIVNVLQVESGSALIAELTGNFGYNVSFFGINVNQQYQAAVLTGFTILLLVLNIVSGKKLVSVIGEVGKKIKKNKKSK